MAIRTDTTDTRKSVGVYDTSERGVQRNTAGWIWALVALIAFIVLLFWIF